MKVILIFIASILASCSTATKKASDKIQIPVQPVSDFQSPKEFEFLSATLDQKKIVQLGESIHMTHEQPLARIGLIRFLNENKNFDVLAFEGSTLDFWVAKDAFLRSQRQQRDVTAFRKTAFFGLWQTREMEQVATIALSTLSTPKPLYITSFDIQPGIGFGFRKRSPFLDLGKSLKIYNSLVDEKEIQSVASSLSSLQGCAQNGFPQTSVEKEFALKAISILEKWIASAQPQIKKKYPSIPHAEALTLVPYSLRRTVELCDTHQKNTDTKNKWAAYQPKRDELNAEVAAQILSEVSHNMRLITWAHHSHVNYNTLNRVRATFGQVLKSQFAGDVFTVGVFAHQGSALIGQEEPSLKELRPAQEAEIDSYLSVLSKESYFANLSGADAKTVDFLTRPATIRIEGINLWKAQLAKDYDAIIYLDKVSPPKVDFAPM